MVPKSGSTMRTFGLRTHVLLAVAAAAGVIAALARPWYAAAPQAVAGQTPVEGLTASLDRLMRESAGTTGWDALGTWGTVIAVLAGVTAACALLCLIPAVQGVAREPARYAAFACLAIIGWKLVDMPPDSELRFGALVAAGAALVAFTSGSAVASTSLRRRASVHAAYASR
jgi:hypothetical protein